MSIKEWFNQYDWKNIGVFFAFISVLAFCLLLFVDIRITKAEEVKQTVYYPYNIINANPIFINNTNSMINALIFKWNDLNCLALYNTGMVCKEMNK